MSDVAYSVVVPAYQAGDTIEPCLRAIFAASPPPAEVIVFDDGSTDGTGNIARRCGARVLTGTEPGHGPSAGRNAGVRAASSDIVVFVDADVVTEPEAPGRLAAAIAPTDGAVAAFGVYAERACVPNVAGRYYNLRHHHVHIEAARDQARDGVATFWSGLGAVDRKAFLAAGGFEDCRAWIEDVELGLRLRARGGTITIVPDAVGHHLKNWTLKSLWRSDVMHRAVPWSQLIADGRIQPTLNASNAERTKAMLAHGILAMLLVSLLFPVALAAVAALATVYLWMNRDLLRVLRRDSRHLTAYGAALHWLYHLYASAVLGGVLLARGFAAPVRRRTVTVPSESRSLAQAR